MRDGLAGVPITKQYFLSSTYPYDRMFLVDSGPQYGEDMGWSSASLAAIGSSPARVAIIDHRITRADVPDLAAAVRAMPGRLFVFTIVDPFTQHNDDGPYRDLLFELMAEPNVVFLSKYQPIEFTARVQAAAGEARFLVLHYPYVAARVAGPDTRPRSRRMIFAGAINAKVYPEREQLYHALRHQPWLHLLMRHLEHPGYPEVGDPLVHQHIGDRFVALLAGYRFMFVSGSRCALEFLKYRECAYARCVPVGFPRRPFRPSCANASCRSIRRARRAPSGATCAGRRRNCGSARRALPGCSRNCGIQPCSIGSWMTSCARTCSASMPRPRRASGLQ